MNTPIREILGNRINQVFYVPFEATVAEAVQEMNQRGVGCVLVMVEDTLIGIFTERDVLTRVVAAGLDPRVTPINRVMTSEPETLHPNDTVGQVLDRHGAKHFRHMPVVEDGLVVGMISVRDLLRYVADENKQRAEKLEQFIETGKAPV